MTSLLLTVSAGAVAGEIVSDKLPSSVLEHSVSFTVYLPDGYYDSFDKYPVVYLLHGSGGDEQVWANHAGVRETLDGLIRRKKIAPIIAVMPDGGSSWWIDGSAEPMQTMLRTELIPYVEKQYEADTGRDQRAFAGMSMGGFGVLNMALSHPELLCAAGLLSPGVDNEPSEHSSARSDTGQFVRNGKFDLALWQNQSYPALLTPYRDKSTTVPIYIESGDHDQQATPIMMAQLFAELYSTQPEQVELRIVDGDHEWLTFRDALPRALTFIQHKCKFSRLSDAVLTEE